MDWHLKAATWDLTELEQAAISNITPSFDRSSSFNDHRTRADFCIDLKLGRMDSSSDKSTSGLKQPGVSRMESSNSGSTKRARGATNGAQAMCLVDGCDSDLSTCRDYHRRHKVCELHSKTPQVTIGGHKQRFCQQCSRFHSLEEFDEGKRSCRKRLDGHNRRRRKPPLDPLPRAGSILPNYQGTQLLPYSRSHVYPSATAVNATWSAVVSNEEGVRYHNLHQQIRSPEKQSFFLESSASNYKGGNHFRFLTSDNLTLNNQTSPGASVCQPLLRSIALSDSFEASSSQGIFRESLTTQAGNSDCALSLLSSTRTQASRNQMVQPNSDPLLQSMESTPNYHSLATMDSVLVSDRREAEVHCQGMLDIPSAGSSGNKVPQTLPFSWE